MAQLIRIDVSFTLWVSVCPIRVICYGNLRNHQKISRGSWENWSGIDCIVKLREIEKLALCIHENLQDETIIYSSYFSLYLMVLTTIFQFVILLQSFSFHQKFL